MTTIELPWEALTMIGVAGLLLLMAAMYFGNYYFEMKRNNPEIHVFNNAQKGKRPSIIALIDPAGRIDFINGIVEPETIKLEEKQYGLLIDPKALKVLPNETISRGRRLFFYGLPFYFPTSLNGARSVIQVVNRIRKEFPMFAFIKDDLRLMEILTMSGDDIEQDIVTIAGSYPIEIPDQITDSEGNFIQLDNDAAKKTYLVNTVASLVLAVEEIKGKLKSWNVQPGYFCLHDGIQLLPLAAQSDDLRKLENNVHAGDMNNLFKGESKWMEVVKIALIMGGFVGVVYIIIKSL